MASGGVIVLALLGYAYGQDSNCDFYQKVEVGQTHYIYSPNYPNDYSPGVQCRWIADCPHGYNCKLDCSEVNLQQSTAGCSLDRLVISKSGDPQLYGAQNYCGLGSITTVSTEQTISVGLITSSNSPGGRFMCQLRAQPASDGGAGESGGSCQCGWQAANRIVGGKEAGVNPSMVALKDLSLSLVKCGGVIIDQYYVLTSAHCLKSMSNPSNVEVLVGGHDISGDSQATKTYKVRSFIIHPNYNQTSYDYDIGLIAMQSAITFSEGVGPACLPFKFDNTDFAGKLVSILGWGTQFIGGPTSNVLLQTEVQVISNHQCSQAVSFLSDRQMCTYTPGKDSCQDDSGGPLLYTDPSTGLLFATGIISSGRLCATAGHPGVNTRVTSFLDWIQSNTPRANYCRK